MNLNAANRVANIGAKSANTLILLLMYLMTVKPGNYIFYSAIVVYLINCQKCPEVLYIGETGGIFRYSFNNHTLHQTKKNSSAAIALQCR